MEPFHRNAKQLPMDSIGSRWIHQLNSKIACQGLPADAGNSGDKKGLWKELVSIDSIEKLRIPSGDFIEFNYGKITTMILMVLIGVNFFTNSMAIIQFANC